MKWLNFKIIAPLAALLCVAVAVEQAECSGFDINLSNDKNAAEKCTILCLEFGNQDDSNRSHYNKKTNTCKCYLNRKNIDDYELALLRKAAKESNILLKTVFTHNHKSLLIKKREAEDEPKPEEENPAADEPNPEKIVAQQTPPLFSKLNPPASRPITLPIRTRANSMSHEQQLLIIQQMRDHLTRLAQATDQRARQLEIEALRTNLRQLSQHSIFPQSARTHLIPSSATPAVVPVNSRIRNAVEEARKRQQQHRLRIGVVGKTHNDKEDVVKNNDEEVASAIKEIKKAHPTFEIITSPTKED